jgi:hypothetical protein
MHLSSLKRLFISFQQFTFNNVSRDYIYVYVRICVYICIYICVCNELQTFCLGVYHHIIIPNNSTEHSPQLVKKLRAL